jgi:hypothetical protein
MNASTLERTIDSVAVEVGRLRRRVAADSSLIHCIARLGELIEGLDALTSPNAAELAREFFAFCGDHDVAVFCALDLIDARVRQLRSLLGSDGQDRFSDSLRPTA